MQKNHEPKTVKPIKEGTTRGLKKEGPPPPRPNDKPKGPQRPK